MVVLSVVIGSAFIAVVDVVPPATFVVVGVAVAFLVFVFVGTMGAVATVFPPGSSVVKLAVLAPVAMSLLEETAWGHGAAVLSR